MKIKLMFLMVLSLLSIQSVLVAQDEKVQPQRVDQESLYSAMDTVSRLAYVQTATANGIRYQTDVIINLLENGASEEACLLFICYKDWYKAFVSVNCPNGVIPEYVTKAYEAEQNIVIDYDQQKNIIDVNPGGNLNLVAYIRLYWLPEVGVESFTYTDTLSVPKLEVTNEMDITYRLLKYDNRVVCDHINGLRGKALDGFLEYLGDARMTQYSLVSEEDVLQYVLMKIVKFWIPIKKYMTIDGEGITTKGISEKKEKKTLRRKIKIQYDQSRMDNLLISSDQFAELECCSDNS